MGRPKEILNSSENVIKWIEELNSAKENDLLFIRYNNSAEENFRKLKRTVIDDDLEDLRTGAKISVYSLRNKLLANKKIIQAFRLVKVKSIKLKK